MVTRLSVFFLISTAIYFKSSCPEKRINYKNQKQEFTNQAKEFCEKYDFVGKRANYSEYGCVSAYEDQEVWIDNPNYQSPKPLSEIINQSDKVFFENLKKTNTPKRIIKQIGPKKQAPQLAQNCETEDLIFALFVGLMPLGIFYLN